MQKTVRTCFSSIHIKFKCIDLVDLQYSVVVSKVVCNVQFRDHFRFPVSIPNVIYLQNVPVKPRLVKATGTTSLQSKVEKENVTEKVVVSVFKLIHCRRIVVFNILTMM